jgi:hypothetical protein
MLRRPVEQLTPSPVASAQPGVGAPSGAAAGSEYEQLAALESQFRDRWESETDDPEWNTGVEEYLAMAMRDAQVPHEALEEVACRTTLCRLTFRFETAQQAVSLGQLQHPDYEQQFFFDGARYTVFVARPGVAIDREGSHER